MSKKMKVNDVKYFKAEEILKSKVAKENNIDNIPTDEKVIDNLNYTLQRLDEIREGYCNPIYITSGYRCNELNKLVGGVVGSYHKKGLATDLRWDAELFQYILDNCSFDQLIREGNKKGDKWIHLGFKRDINKERNQVVYLYDK